MQKLDSPPNPSSIPSNIDHFDELNKYLFDCILNTFSNYRAKVIEHLVFRDLSLKRSAVTLNLTIINGKLYILFTKRPVRKGDKWSGQVCFPGGKFEKNEDKTLLDTAIRETFEEIGVDLRDESNFKLVGRVDDHLAQGNMPVSCFVYFWKDLTKVKYNLSVGEVDGMRWFPLENFLATGSRDQRIKTKQYDKFGNVSNTSVLTFSIGLVYPKVKQYLDKLSIKDIKTYFPCIKITSSSIHDESFEKPELEFILWGLTLRMLSTFLRIIDQSLPLMDYDYEFEYELLDWFRKNYSKLDSTYLRQYYKEHNQCEHSELPIEKRMTTDSVDSKPLLLERLSKL